MREGLLGTYPLAVHVDHCVGPEELMSRYLNSEHCIPIRVRHRYRETEWCRNFDRSQSQ